MLKDTISNIKRLIRGRAVAYNQVFDNNNIHTAQVLKDLSVFCRANESTFHKDKSVSDRLDGRREVWLRIQNNLKLTTQELYNLHGIKHD